MDTPKNSQPKAQYEKPQVVDYGELRELTATQATGTHTDVPKGTPVPPFNIFS